MTNADAPHRDPGANEPYSCSACGRGYGLSAPKWRCDCGGTLDFRIRPPTLAALNGAQPGPWRYAELLPGIPQEDRILLGEQATPLIPCKGQNAWLKLDYLMPSGSYKDRGASVLVSRLAHLGIRAVDLDSSGNAGAAISAYCAAAGITCRVFAPERNSPTKLAQIVATGAQLHLVQGSRMDVTRAAMAAAGSEFYASHNWSPDFAAGMATLAFELWEQLGQRAPSSVLAPCGNGGIILGLYKGFAALADGGLIERPPALIAVQSRAFDSVANALRQGMSEPQPRRTAPATIAEGIACEVPVRGTQLLDAIRSSDGNAISVSEREIEKATIELAANGIYVEPTGAAGMAGLAELRKHTDTHILGPDPVVILTGSGLKAGRKVADLRSSHR